jgi:endonuclease/exonuclease/phosphatase family metal-dependent hydrolase
VSVPITAMTYNVLLGGGDRLDAILAVITDQRPDVLALQELRGFTGPDGRSRVRRVADALGMRAFVAGSGYGQPVGVLVRTSARVLDAGPVSGPFHHAVVRVVVDTDAGPMTVLGTHLFALSGRYRLTEVRRLARLADPAGRVLMMGDLNSLDPAGDHAARVAAMPARYRLRHLTAAGRPDTRAVAALERAGFVDLFRRAGIPPAQTVPTRYRGSEFPAARLDYVLGTPMLAHNVLHCQVVRGGLADTASDHYPVVAEFDLRLR